MSNHAVCPVDAKLAPFSGHEEIPLKNKGLFGIIGVIGSNQLICLRHFFVGRFFPGGL
jgi:hypothetical protein